MGQPWWYKGTEENGVTTFCLPGALRILVNAASFPVLTSARHHVTAWSVFSGLNFPGYQSHQLALHLLARAGAGWDSFSFPDLVLGFSHFPRRGVTAMKEGGLCSIQLTPGPWKNPCVVPSAEKSWHVSEAARGRTLPKAFGVIDNPGRKSSLSDGVPASSTERFSGAQCARAAQVLVRSLISQGRSNTPALLHPVRVVVVGRPWKVIAS